MAVGLWVSPARAQMREFTGHVDSVTDSVLVVNNRMGDQVAFQRADDTAVEGARESWEALRADDHVTVYWRFADEPRRARRVVVMPVANR
jgi:hypothetical protein